MFSRFPCRGKNKKLQIDHFLQNSKSMKYFKAPHRFGVSTLLFRELSLEKALENISYIKLKKVDLSIILPKFCPHYDPLKTNEENDKRLKELFERFGLKLSTLNLVPGYFNKDDPKEVSHFIRRCVNIAKILGGHSITIPSGIKVDSKEWLKNVKIVKRFILDDAKFSLDNGIQLSLETPHSGTLTETIEETKSLYEILDSDFIKCTFDTSHVIRGEKNSIVDGLNDIGIDKINHFHLRDTIGYECSFTPGKGHGDFSNFFKKIKSISYTGDFIIELEFEDLSAKEKFKELNFALQYCLSLYYSGKIPTKIKNQSNNLYQLISRFKHNPKSEIKRHKTLFLFLRRLKPLILKIIPEKVYHGKWIYKYRFSKNKVVIPRPRSFIVKKDPQELYRIAIVGCGWAGRKMHGPGFERLNNTKIIGVYDIDKEKTDESARRFNCEAHSSLEELVRYGQPDIATVCSREWSHHESVVYLLANGVDVFCEKIMATRYKDALDMVKIAKKNNQILAINYNYRFMPGIRKIREIIEQKALGELAFFNINVHAMSYHHALDLLTFLGGKIITINGSFNNVNSIRNFGNTDWSLYDNDILYVPSINASVTCEFESGAIGVMNSSYFYNLPSFVLSIEAVFERGCVTLNGINGFNIVGNLSYISTDKIRKVNMNYKKGVYAKGYEYTFYSSIESFMRNYVQAKQPETPGEHGLFNIIIEKAISLSNKQKTKINLSEFLNHLIKKEIKEIK